MFGKAESESYWEDQYRKQMEKSGMKRGGEIILELYVESSESFSFYEKSWSILCGWERSSCEGETGDAGQKGNDRG